MLMKTRRGFTLIELLVALVILTMLAVAGYHTGTSWLRCWRQPSVTTPTSSWRAGTGRAAARTGFQALRDG